MQSAEHEEPLPPGYPSVRCVRVTVLCFEANANDRLAALFFSFRAHTKVVQGNLTIVCTERLFSKWRE